MSALNFITAINHVAENGHHLSFNLTNVEKPKLGIIERILRAIFPESYLQAKIKIAQNLTLFIERNVNEISSTFTSQDDLEAFKAKVQTIVETKLMRSRKDATVQDSLNAALKNLAVPQVIPSAPIEGKIPDKNGYAISERTIQGLLESLKETLPGERQGYNDKVIKERLIDGLRSKIRKALICSLDEQHKETDKVVEKCKILITQADLSSLSVLAKPMEIFEKMMNADVLTQAFIDAGFEVS